jgi:STAS domain
MQQSRCSQAARGARRRKRLGCRGGYDHDHAAGRCVIVDLAELEFADCAALNGLREVQNLARQGGGDMLLAEPSGIVLRLLTLTERFAIVPAWPPPLPRVRIHRDVRPGGPRSARRPPGRHRH